MGRQISFLFPALDGPLRLTQIGRNLLPGVETRSPASILGRRGSGRHQLTFPREALARDGPIWPCVALAPRIKWPDYLTYHGPRQYLNQAKTPYFQCVCSIACATLRNS